MYLINVSQPGLSSLGLVCLRSASCILMSPAHPKALTNSNSALFDPTTEGQSSIIAMSSYMRSPVQRDWQSKPSTHASYDVVAEDRILQTSEPAPAHVHGKEFSQPTAIGGLVSSFGLEGSDGDYVNWAFESRVLQGMMHQFEVRFGRNRFDSSCLLTR
jgi:hypothetical protein